jgi:hypothetical protein
LLACPPGEFHDVSLILFGLALRRRGWRITFLGANTPMEDIFATGERIDARLTVLFASNWDGHRALVPVLAANAARVIALGGATAGPIAEAAGCRWLWGDPIAAAEEVSKDLAAASSTSPARHGMKFQTDGLRLDPNSKWKAGHGGDHQDPSRSMEGL